VEEAQAVTQFVVEKVAGRATVLAGVGHDLKTAREMALAAQETGADGVMVHQPSHPYLMAEGLIRYYSQIARGIRVGVALYVRHPAIDRDVLDRVTALDNVVAVKYAINDLPTFATIAQSVDHSVAWVCGTAEMWAPFFFAAGAQGFTSGLVNVAPEKSLAMLAALRQGDRRSVMAVWKEVAPLEKLRQPPQRQQRHRDKGGDEPHGSTGRARQGACRRAERGRQTGAGAHPEGLGQDLKGICPIENRRSAPFGAERRDRWRIE
jgi:4-hydroxy-tetrahydrodipicolinate synthase